MLHRLSYIAALAVIAAPFSGRAQSVALPMNDEILGDVAPASPLFDGVETTGAIEPIRPTDALMTLEDADQIAEVTSDLLPVSKHPLTFRLGTGVISDDNIFLTSKDPTKDVIIQYVGGFSYELHKNETTKLAMDYDVTGYHLMDNSENDSLDQIGKLSAGYNFSKLKIDFLGSYQHLTGAERQLGNFVDRDVMAARATMIYELGPKTRLKAEGAYSGASYKNLQSFTDYSARAGVDYKLGTKTAVGLAFVAGSMETKVSNGLATTERTTSENAATTKLTEEQATANATLLANDAAELQALQQSGADQETIDQLTAKQTANRNAIAKKNAAALASAKKQAARGAASRTSTQRQFYKQLLLTASYEATGKISLSMDAGMDFREYEGAAATDDRSNFTFRLTGTYKMRERTLLSLSGARVVEGSAAVLGVSVRRNTFQVGVDQQIGERMRLAVNLGYDVGEFESSRTDISSDRTDDFLFGKATLTYNLSKHAYLSAFYELRDQNSSQDTLTYTNNRYGIQLGITF